MTNDTNHIFKIKEENAFYTSVVRDFYKPMDLCHDEKHFDEVYNEAMKLGFWSVANNIISMYELRLLLAAAAYHDVGRCKGDNLHDKYSCDMIDDCHQITSILYKNFEAVELNVIKEAISAHRRSHKATSEIARILKDADKISRTNRERALYRFIGFNYTHIYMEKYGDTLELTRIIRPIPNLSDQKEIKAEIVKRFTDYYNKSKSYENGMNMHIHNSIAAQHIYRNNEKGFVHPPTDEEMDRTFPKVMYDLADKIETVGLYTQE